MFLATVPLKLFPAVQDFDYKSLTYPAMNFTPIHIVKTVSGLFITLKSPQQGQEPILKLIMYYNHQKNRIRHTLSSRFLI